MLFSKSFVYAMQGDSILIIQTDNMVKVRQDVITENLGRPGPFPGKVKKKSVKGGC